MKAFCTLLKNELKLNIRNMNMVIFAVIWPLAVLVILGLLYGTSPAADGVDYTFLAVHGCAVRYLHLRRRADGPSFLKSETPAWIYLASVFRDL